MLGVRKRGVVCSAIAHADECVQLNVWNFSTITLVINRLNPFELTTGNKAVFLL